MKQSWVVTVKCEVIKQIITSECTEEEAEERPYDFAEDEVETEQHDWEVLSVKPNP